MKKYYEKEAILELIGDNDIVVDTLTGTIQVEQFQGNNDVGHLYYLKQKDGSQVRIGTRGTQKAKVDYKEKGLPLELSVSYLDHMNLQFYDKMQKDMHGKTKVAERNRQ